MAYIPSKDTDLIDWGLNYVTLLNSDPSRYGVFPAEAALLQTEFDDFNDAYALAIDPATKTAVSVAHKDGEKALFLHDARAVAAAIRANIGVSDADKAALGLTIPDPVPTPIPDPTTQPLLNVIAATNGSHTMTFADTLTPDLKRKPFGVTGAILYASYTTGINQDFLASDAKLVAILTKTPSLISIPMGNAGKFANYWLQWVNRKGKVGPLSQPRSYVCT